jgi:hypothetical protein
MSRESKRVRPRRRAPQAELPARTDGALADTLDELRATVIALLASLRVKEQALREQGGAHPSPGVLAGLSDIGAIRVWADRTLRTIEVLADGKIGDVARLLEELGEFRELVGGSALGGEPPL